MGLQQAPSSLPRGRISGEGKHANVRDDDVPCGGAGHDGSPLAKFALRLRKIAVRLLEHIYV